jgi:hypothetical protein
MTRTLPTLLLCFLPLLGFAASERPLIPVDLVTAQDPAGFSVIRHGDGYLLVRFTPRTDGLQRVDAQRISADGTLRDVEPIHLAATRSGLRIVATKQRTLMVSQAAAGFRLLAFDEDLQPLFERRIEGPFPYAVAATDDRLLMIRHENSVVRAEVWDEDGVLLGSSVLFGSGFGVAVGAAPVDDGFVVAASSRQWGETRAVRIEESGRAGDIRVIERAGHETIQVVANEQAVLVLGATYYTPGVKGLILNTNAEVQSGPFSIFPDAAPNAFAAAGVDGGFLVASQPGVQIGWIPSDGDSVVHSGVLGQPGTLPAAASSGRGDALFVYRSAGIMTGKLIGPGLENTAVEIRAAEAGEQARIEAASTGGTDLAAWVEWTGGGDAAFRSAGEPSQTPPLPPPPPLAWTRASRVVDGVAIDNPALLVAPARVPLNLSPIGLAASDSEFVVIGEGMGRRISAGGELGNPITPNSRIVDSDGRDFRFFTTFPEGVSTRTLLGGTDFLTPWTRLLERLPSVRYERLDVSAAGPRYLLTWDDFAPCMILCPPQRVVVRGTIVGSDETLIVPPFEIMEADQALSATDGERFLVAGTKSRWRTALALLDPLGRRLDGGSVSEPMVIATNGALRDAWWDGSRFTVATEDALFEVGEDLQLTSVRAIPTTLDGSPSVGFIAPDSLLYTSATGVGEPSGGVPRVWISTLTREPQVDLAVRIERVAHRVGERLQLVVTNESDTTATGIVLLSVSGPLPTGPGCELKDLREARCRRDSLAGGAEWRMDLVESGGSSQALPLNVFVAARELDTNPANNQNPEVVEGAGRARESWRGRSG